MSSLIIVAPTIAEARQYATDAGLDHQGPQFASGSSQLHGFRDATVIVVSRSRLPSSMENALAMAAQQRGLTVVTIPEAQPRASRLALDTLQQMPPDAFLKAFMMRFGPGEHRVELGEEYVISIRQAIEPPQFETAEEALEWLDAQTPEAQSKLEKAKAAENAHWYGPSGPMRPAKGILR